MRTWTPHWKRLVRREQPPEVARHVEIAFWDVFEVRDGKVARARNYFDAATMMTQLGQTDAGPSAEVANTALARRWFDAMTAGDLDVVDTLFWR